MKGDECRPATDEALLLAFLRAAAAELAALAAAAAASAAAIDMSNGGGQEEDEEDEDVVGDDILGDGGPKPDPDISSLPNQSDETGLPSDTPSPHPTEPVPFSCEPGDNNEAGRFLPSSLLVVEEPVTGLKSGSSLTMGGRSSDWLALTASTWNDPAPPARETSEVSGGLGEPLLSLSSNEPSPDATPLAKAPLAAATEAVVELVAAEVWTAKGAELAFSPSPVAT